VSELSRDLIIQIARSLKEPVINGEVNEWLYDSGFRPYVEPLLELPQTYPWLNRFSPLPALLLDIGWFIRDWNREMGSLIRVPRESLKGLEANLIVQLFAPDGVFSGRWSNKLLGHMLHRLVIQWQPYVGDPWLSRLKDNISRRIGMSWNTLLAAYHVTLEDSIPSTSEILVFAADGEPAPLRFRSNSVPVPLRPDLTVTHYYPLDDVTEKWCQKTVES
jgi:hypothetical protein